MSGPLPVVLVHGLRMNGAMWSALADRLRSDREVAAPDLPGHGGRSGQPFDVDGAAEVLRETVDSLGGRAVLVGHSLGGGIAMRTAARYPDAAAALVGIGCTFPRGGGPSRSAYRALTWLSAHESGWVDRVTVAALRRMLPAEVAEPTLAGGLSTGSVPGVMAAMAEFDAAAELSRYAGPVWLVNGTYDQFRFGERACLRACHDGRLAVWPGLNHLTVLGEVDRIATLVEDVCAVVERG